MKLYNWKLNTSSCMNFLYSVSTRNVMHSRTMIESYKIVNISSIKKSQMWRVVVITWLNNIHTVLQVKLELCKVE